MSFLAFLHKLYYNNMAELEIACKKIRNGNKWVKY